VNTCSKTARALSRGSWVLRWRTLNAAGNEGTQPRGQATLDGEACDAVHYAALREHFSLFLATRRCSSEAEQLFRKQQVVGSSPTTGSRFPNARVLKLSAAPHHTAHDLPRAARLSIPGLTPILTPIASKNAPMVTPRTRPHVHERPRMDQSAEQTCVSSSSLPSHAEDEDDGASISSTRSSVAAASCCISGITCE
jgi:hypothetical protein